MATVIAVIVNFHQERMTEQAIDSVLASEGIESRVILIDNESDGTAFGKRYAAEPRVETISNRENIGFGAACNQGIERALGRCDFVFFLNNDATVEPRTLAALAAQAQLTGAAAPKILLPDGRFYAAGGLIELRKARARNRAIYQTDQGQHEAREGVAFASACALLVSSRFLAQGARFFEPYFLYYEDADFCLTLGRLGCRIQYEPAARVIHQESASTTPAQTSRLVYYNARNRLLFLHRNGNWPERLAGGAYALAVILGHALRNALAGRAEYAYAALGGLLDYYHGRFGPMDLRHF